MPTMVATAMAVMAFAMVVTDTARGLLMPMPTMAATAMAVMALAMVVTDTARGLLMPMPTMAATAMVVMATAVAMDTARGPLMPTTVAATAMASKPTTNLKVCNSILTPKLSSQNIIHNSAAWKIDGCVSFNYRPNNK